MKQLTSARESKPPHSGRLMDLDGLQRNAERGGNLLVAVAARGLPKDFQLAGRCGLWSRRGASSRVGTAS